MRFCDGVDENFYQNHDWHENLIAASQIDSQTCRMVLEWCWYGVEASTIAIGGLEGSNTIGIALKILMQKNVFG